jgi:hypothetical protein
MINLLFIIIFLIITIFLWMFIIIEIKSHAKFVKLYKNMGEKIDIVGNVILCCLGVVIQSCLLILLLSLIKI